MRNGKNCLQTFGLLVTFLLMMLPDPLFASGYSEYENHRIWQLRLEAKRQASVVAQQRCTWAPKTTESFSDESPLRVKATNERLFLSIMRMLRLDQNARDLAVAFDNEQGPAYRKVLEVDADNLGQLKKIIATHGFPTLGEVGDTGVNAMLMLVAHADRDLGFQKSVSQDMDNQVARGTHASHVPGGT